MTNCSASKFTALPGPHTPTPTSYNTLTAAVIAAKEVQPPSVWSTAFDPVEEGAMPLLQQAVLKMLAMAIHDEGLTCERTRSQPVQVLGRRVRY